MPLRKFTVEEKNYSSVWAATDITRWEPFTWPIKHTYLTLAITINCPLKLLKLNFKYIYINSRFLGGVFPKLWDGFMWLTPGYGNLSLKLPPHPQHHAGIE